MKTKYLFCYFTGNRPEEETVHFAVSSDGYHFEALKDGRQIFVQTLGKKCCRDPYIFRDETGVFHIIATDMRSQDGWSSNNSMVVWDSDDLVSWKNERIIDFSRFEETALADRVWAPEVIFDKTRGEYMIYWSNHNQGEAYTVMWYAYTKDFATLTTAPKLLHTPKNGLSGIDGDIAEKDGKFYLYFGDEKAGGTCYAVSDKLSGPYTEPENNYISVAGTAVEGNCIYKLLGTDKHIMIMDKYVDGGYFMQETIDMTSFTGVETDKFALDHLRPRHASVLHITDEEYRRLVEAFGK